MILKTFSKETKELLRDGRVRISIVLVLLLLVVAVFVSSKQYEKMNLQYQTATATERSVWDNQGAKNPHSAAHYGTYAFKPKLPLSLIDRGVDKYVGNSIFLEAHNRNEAQFSEVTDQTGLARFGELTPDFVLLFIIPLLIILLGYNSFTKERESKTLIILKSQGVVYWKWVLGKWLSLFVPIFIIVTVLFLTAGILLTSLQDFGVFKWESLASMYLLYLGYYAIFINLVLIISSKVKKSGIALVTSLSVWVLACLIAPKVASNIAGSKHPYPTSEEFAAKILEDKRNGLDGHNPWNEVAKNFEKEVLREFGVDSIHKLPFNFAAYRTQKSEEHQAEIYAKHYNELKELYYEQASVYKGLAFISPYLPVRFASMSIAQTDYDSHWGFADAAENYRILKQKFLNDNTANNTKYGERGYVASADFWKELPKFNYKPLELKAIINRNTTNLLAIGIWLLVSFSTLFLTTKKL